MNDLMLRECIEVRVGVFC